MSVNRQTQYTPRTDDGIDSQTHGRRSHQLANPERHYPSSWLGSDSARAQPHRTRQLAAAPRLVATWPQRRSDRPGKSLGAKTPFPETVLGEPAQKQGKSQGNDPGQRRHVRPRAYSITASSQSRLGRRPFIAEMLNFCVQNSSSGAYVSCTRAESSLRRDSRSFSVRML